MISSVREKEFRRENLSSVRNNGLQKVGEVKGRKGDGGVQLVVGHAPRGCRRRGRREPVCHFDRQRKIASGRKSFVRNEQGFANSRRCEEQRTVDGEFSSYYELNPAM